MYVFSGLIILLLCCIGRIAEKNSSRIDAVAKSIDKHLKTERRIFYTR